MCPALVELVLQSPYYVSHRNDILLLLDLKAACDACDFELQSLKLASPSPFSFISPLTPPPLSRHRYENLPEHQQVKISMPEATPATPKKVSPHSLSFQKSKSISFL